MCILSLGGPCVLRFSPHLGLQAAAAAAGAAPPPDCRVFLPPRSLLLFDGAAYTEYLHGIDRVREDVLEGVANPQHAPDGEAMCPRGERVSLTVRRVVKQRDVLRRPG